MKLHEIIAFVEGKGLHLTPEQENQDFSDIRGLEDAGPEEISFLYHPKYLRAASQSEAAIYIISESLVDEFKKPAIVVAQPRKAVIQLVYAFYPAKKKKPSIHPSAVIDPTAEIGENVFIGPTCVICANAKVGDDTVLDAQVYLGDNVTVGKGCHLYAGVKVFDDCVLHDQVVLHGNTVIGADGFGYVQREGKNIKVPQVARVVIHSDVEIGACTTVDRGFLTDTVIGENTKVDNQVQIAHNDKIGKSCIIVSKCAIGGSVKIGDQSMIGGCVPIKDNIRIGSKVMVPAFTPIGTNIKDGTVLTAAALTQKLLERTVKKMVKKVERLSK